MKDWHLLLLAAGIVMIQVVYLIPLLILIYVMGGARFETDDENPSYINASDSIIMICLSEPKSSLSLKTYCYITMKN